MTNNQVNEPAFPMFIDKTHIGMGFEQNKGMILRDYFASHADIPWNAVLDTLSLKYPGKCGIFTIQDVINQRAYMKYVEADAMLEHRNQQSKG